MFVGRPDGPVDGSLLSEEIGLDVVGLSVVADELIKPSVNPIIQIIETNISLFFIYGDSL